MLGQDEQSKMEKFIETMPTIIQTHLIIDPDWKHITKKTKKLQHIICKCEAPVIAPAPMQATAAVPGIHSHIAQSHNQDANDIIKPFKSTKGTGGKKSGKGKQKLNSSLNHLPLHQRNKKNNTKKQIPITTMKIIEVITEAAEPTGDNMAMAGDLIEGPNLGAGVNKATIGDNIKITVGNTICPTEAIIIIKIIMAIIEVEVDVTVAAIITGVTVME